MRWLALFLIIFTACSEKQDQRTDEADEEETAENALHIHFQQGFHQDTVVLLHAGEKIYEKVLTSPQASELTDKFSIPQESLTDTIYFKVKQKGNVLQGYIPPKAEQYVGFFLTSGSVVNIYSRKDPFRYQQH